MTDLILASASPRRLSLLSDIGIVPTRVVPSDVDETQHRGELPRAMALRLAVEKGACVAQREAGHFVLSADTIVALGRRQLPKAESAQDVRRYLTLLSGRKHRVFTGVALFAPDGSFRSRLSASTVTFKRMDALEIEHYVDSHDGVGKAGGYAIQGRAAAYIRAISGSYSGIVGLPLFDVSQMLQQAGWIK